jgi:MFS family permease
MRFILGVLWGYYIRGRKRLLIITLTIFTVFMLLWCVVIPAIALSILGLSVMRERASRPPQTSVPSLVGLNYEVPKAECVIRILMSAFWPIVMTYRMSLARSSSKPRKLANA